jgi:hypothetical protein
MSKVAIANAYHCGEPCVQSFDISDYWAARVATCRRLLLANRYQQIICGVTLDGRTTGVALLELMAAAGCILPVASQVHISVLFNAYFCEQMVALLLSQNANHLFGLSI